MKLAAMESVLSASGDAETFARAALLGLEGVEIALQLAQLRDAASTRASGLRDLVQTHAIEVPSLVLGEHNSGGLATWWRDAAQCAAEVRMAIDCCSEVGASALLLPFFFFNEPKGRTHRAIVAERLTPVCDYAAEKGVIVAFEGVLHAEHLLELAAAVNSPGFGVYYDPANATWCDYDPARELRALGKLVRQMHIKDARVFTGDTAAGEGRVDWAGVATALDVIGFNRWLSLETPGGPVESVSRDVGFARRTFTRLNGTVDA